MQGKTHISASLQFQSGTAEDAKYPAQGKLSADAYVNQLQNRVRL